MRAAQDHRRIGESISRYKLDPLFLILSIVLKNIDCFEELKVDAEDTVLSAGSPDRFGYEWHKYPDLRPEYEEQFHRWTAHLRPEDWCGRTFLDVGCGMGRNSYWPMIYGAAGGLAIDVDDRSLAAAKRILAPFPNVRIEKRSSYEIGFEDEFDLVFSIGVIHHLQYPERALANMVQATKPGGRVLIWVYGFENNEWIVRLLNPVRKAVFSRLPVGLVHYLALYPTAVLWLMLRLDFGSLAYFQLLRRFKFRHLRSVVFDQMLPKIAHYWRREKVERMMREQGLVDVKLIWVNEISWSAVGRKPSATTQ
jgi:SAM-dependent methyltransferase